MATLHNITFDIHNDQYRVQHDDIQKTWTLFEFDQLSNQWINPSVYKSKNENVKKYINLIKETNKALKEDDAEDTE